MLLFPYNFPCFDHHQITPPWIMTLLWVLVKVKYCFFLYLKVQMSQISEAHQNHNGNLWDMNLFFTNWINLCIVYVCIIIQNTFDQMKNCLCCILQTHSKIILYFIKKYCQYYFIILKLNRCYYYCYKRLFNFMCLQPAT